MLLSTTYGSEAFANPNRSVTIAVYSKSQPGDDEPRPLFNAARDPKSNISLRNTNVNPASGLNPAHGEWTTTSYDLPEGSLVKVWVQHKYETDIVYDETFFLLMIRQAAGLKQLGIRLTEHERALTGWAYYEGRFDIIDPEDFTQLDITYLPGEVYGSEAYCDISDNFRIEILEPGNVFVPPRHEAITTRSGAVAQMASGKRRLIRFRRP